MNKYVSLFSKTEFERPVWYTWVLTHAVLLSILTIFIGSPVAITVFQSWMTFVTFYTGIFIVGRTAEKITSSKKTDKSE